MGTALSWASLYYRCIEWGLPDLTQLAILSKSEQRTFDRPPILSNDEQRLRFNITPEVRMALARMKSTVNQAGFLLQTGYFQSSGKFYSARLFRRRDVSFVCRQLGIENADLTLYVDTVPRRHRSAIRSILGWRRFDEVARQEMTSHAHRYVANQEYPEHIFERLCDLCWKRRWDIPPYHELAEIITRAFNTVDQRLLLTLERLLSPEHVKELEILVRPFRREHKVGLKTPITELKIADHSLRTSAIKQSIRTLRYFRDHFFKFEAALLKLPLSDKATDYYATWLAKADHQQITQFPNRFKTYLHLLAFIKHQFFQRQDMAIDTLLKSVNSARNSANKKLAEERLAKIENRNNAVLELRSAQVTMSECMNGIVNVMRAADHTPHEKYYKIESLVNDFIGGVDPSEEARFQALDNDLERESRNNSYYAILGLLSKSLQLKVSDIVRTVVFDRGTSDSTLIAAIDHFKATDGRLDERCPCDFLTNQEHEQVFDGNGFGIALYKCLLFFHIGHGIKSGHLNVLYSYRYRSFEDYMINRAEWRTNKRRILSETGLSTFLDGESTLQMLEKRLDEQFVEVNTKFLDGRNSHMSVGHDGRCRVRTASTDYDTSSFISSTLSQQGIVPILRLLKGIDHICDFTSSFRHFSTKNSKMDPAPETLMAGILAYGCNIGLGKLAKISTGLNEDSLRNTVNWFFSEETLKAANRSIIEVISELALANNYVNNPPTIHSSSDGRKMNVSVDCLHANYSFKYFGKGKGVTDYTFVDERHTLFHAQVFSSSDREAPYVIDGLLDNHVGAGHIHSTDTHGFTEVVFGVSHLLGFAFAPRLAKVHKQRLYSFRSPKTYHKKGYALLPSRPINRKLILQNWDEVLRFVATIKTGHTTASQLFKRLSSYALDHPLYRALKEFGRIVKTQFILSYYHDINLRHQIQMQLNRVELANKFSAYVFFDNDQAFRAGSLHQQEIAVNCKILLQNAIVLWNYLSLSETLLESPNLAQRREIVEAIRRGSMMTWGHVNLRGEYAFSGPSSNDAIFDYEKIKSLRIN